MARTSSFSQVRSLRQDECVSGYMAAHEKGHGANCKVLMQILNDGLSCSKPEGPAHMRDDVTRRLGTRADLVPGRPTAVQGVVRFQHERLSGTVHTSL
ncbi:hypothetical protein TREES_T100007429 [Tupaia chinensis]|uniref:Uncharacterized protein n=1 Tax=Tupaia chinensis TaxID=246437 RepID=L9KZP8_TUPCH|nr:hypothetical protein TREES_T100007429 [Tupaia chinensis]